VAKTTTVAGFTRKRAERNTFPDHLPRERVVIAPPTTCECCGGTRLRKLGEDVTRTLEVIPRQWKVIETVREKCEQRAKLSRGHDLAKAVDYILKRWKAFTLFLDDGRACLSNNAAERALRGIALGRRSWMFCGSDRGGQRAAAMYSLIVTATRYEDGFLFTGFCIDICSRRPKRSHGERIPLVRLTYKRH
jgi:Transposase IS66 family/zinc-finger binding domain of transposase IS66